MRLIDADVLMSIVSPRPMSTKAFHELVARQPTVEPEPKAIGYRECANALLMMWMDNVLTDGEYGRIMDKLNTKWTKVGGADNG